MTIHHFNHHGKTKFVTKRCAVREECQLAGCRHHKNTQHVSIHIHIIPLIQKYLLYQNHVLQECISCCEGMVCNVELPTNHSNAVFAQRQTHSSAAPTFRIWDCVILLVPVLMGLLPLWSSIIKTCSVMNSAANHWDKWDVIHTGILIQSDGCFH